MKKRIQILLIVLTIAAMHPLRAEAHLEPISILHNGEPATAYAGKTGDSDSQAESLILFYYQAVMEGCHMYNCRSLDEYMKQQGQPYTQENVDWVLGLLGITREQADAYNAAAMARWDSLVGNTSSTTESVMPSCDHDYKEETTHEATCAEPGEITYKCSKCGDTYTEEIPATGEHEYVEETTIEASCTHTGVLTSTCSICGAHTSKMIPRLEHQYSAEITTPASCENDGVITYTCALCGDSYKESTPHTGHQEGEGIITKAATLFSSGIIEYHCTECGDCLRKENVPSKIQAFWGK